MYNRSFMIFKFRALSGEVEDFARDYEISSESTLFDLHQLIREDLNYDPAQMASFFTVDHDWNKLREFTLFDMGDENDSNHEAPVAMDAVTLNSIIEEKNQRLLYVFDIFNDRGLFMEVLDRKNAEEGMESPAVTFSIGDAPFQIEIPKSSGSVYDDVMDDFNDFESYEEYDTRYDDEY